MGPGPQADLSLAMDVPLRPKAQLRWLSSSVQVEKSQGFQGQTENSFQFISHHFTVNQLYQSYICYTVKCTVK